MREIGIFLYDLSETVSTKTTTEILDTWIMERFHRAVDLNCVNECSSIATEIEYANFTKENVPTYLQGGVFFAELNAWMEMFRNLCQYHRIARNLMTPCVR